MEYLIRYLGTVLGIGLAAAIVPGLEVSRLDQGVAVALLTVLVVAAVFLVLSQGLLKLTSGPLALIAKALPGVLTVLLISLWALLLDALVLVAISAASDALDLSFSLNGFWSVVFTTLILAGSQLVATLVLAMTPRRDAEPSVVPGPDDHRRG